MDESRWFAGQELEVVLGDVALRWCTATMLACSQPPAKLQEAALVLAARAMVFPLQPVPLLILAPPETVLSKESNWWTVK